MAKFFDCWLTDVDEDVDKTYESHDAEIAALSYAEFAYHNRDCWECASGGYSVTVKEVDGPAHVFDVAVEAVPSFSVTRRKRDEGA